MKKLLVATFALIVFVNNFAFGVELTSLPIPTNRSDIYCVKKGKNSNGYCFVLYDNADGAISKIRRIDNLTNDIHYDFAKVCFGCFGYDGTSMTYGGTGNLYIEYFENSGSIDSLTRTGGYNNSSAREDYNKVQRGIGHLYNRGTIGEIDFGSSFFSGGDEVIGIRKITNWGNIGTIKPGYDKDGIFELVNYGNITTVINQSRRTNNITNNKTIDSLLFQDNSILNLSNFGTINNIGDDELYLGGGATPSMRGENHRIIKSIGYATNKYFHINIDNFSNREGGTIDKILNGGTANIKIINGYGPYGNILGNMGTINNIENNGTMNIEIDNRYSGTIGKIYNSNTGTMDLKLDNEQSLQVSSAQGIVGDIENYGTMTASISNSGIMNGIDNIR